MEPIDYAGPPSNLRVLDTSRDSISLTWSKPAYDGGSEITGYFIEKVECTEVDVEEDEDKWEVVSSNHQSTKCLLQNLSHDIFYNVRISSINEGGVGEYSQLPGTIRILIPKNTYFKFLI